MDSLGASTIISAQPSSSTPPLTRDDQTRLLHRGHRGHTGRGGALTPPRQLAPPIHRIVHGQRHVALENAPHGFREKRKRSVRPGSPAPSDTYTYTLTARSLASGTPSFLRDLAITASPAEGETPSSSSTCPSGNSSALASTLSARFAARSCAPPPQAGPPSAGYEPPACARARETSSVRMTG